MLDNQVPDVNTVSETTEEEIKPKEEQIDVKSLVEEAVKKVQDEMTSQINGLNKRNTTLEKELKDKELEKLSEEDRLKEEIKQAKLEKEQLENETQELFKSRIIDKALFEAGLPQDFASRVNGNDEQSILDDVAKLNDYIKAEAEKQAKTIVNERLGGKAPESGVAPTDGSLQAQYDKAKKSGNMLDRITIKRKAAEDGVIINE